MKPHSFLLSAISLAAPALVSGAPINAPKLGVIRCGDHTVRAVYGLQANLIVGQAIHPFADTASFSDFGGLVAHQGNIQLLGANGAFIAEYDSHEAQPLLNVAGPLTTAIAYLPSKDALLRWTGTGFKVTELKGGFLGRATSVQVDNANSARLLATTADGHVSEIAVSLETGLITSIKLLPGVEGPAYLQGPFLLFHDRYGLEIEENGLRTAVPLAAPDLTYERMSSDRLHLSSITTKESWVLHLNGNVVELSELPAAKDGAQQ